MSVFTKAANQQAFLKAGIMGFQGSGKTYTAVEIMLGLHKHTKSKKPIFFMDTETGSDWAIPRFKDAKVELMVAKTRAFKDLLAGVEEAEKEGFGIIIDSVSHYWTEMVEAYKNERNIGAKMAFHHWAILKPEWQRFSNAYVNSKIHAIVCGRAGWEWMNEEDEEGHRELVKGGTKMKVEGEFGYEPSLLIEMERVKEAAGTTKNDKGKKVPYHTVGEKIIHRCWVIKDRRMDGESMDGKCFNNPKFSDFMPHIACLNIGGEHVGVDTSRNSGALFEQQGESWPAVMRRKQIIIEEMNGELEAKYPGTGKEEKRAKAALKRRLFKTWSDTKIESLDVETLESGLGALRDILTDINEAARIVAEEVQKDEQKKEAK